MNELDQEIQDITDNYLTTRQSAKLLHVTKHTFDGLKCSGRLDKIRCLVFGNRNFYHKEDLLELIMSAQKYTHKWKDRPPAIPIQERKRLQQTGGNVFNVPASKQPKQASADTIKNYFDQFRI